MANKVVTLFKEATELDEADRATLAGLLLESLDHEPATGVDAAWAEEIERRIQQLESGEVKTVSWEEVKASLLLDEHADPGRLFSSRCNRGCSWRAPLVCGKEPDSGQGICHRTGKFGGTGAEIA
jgi:putative addiction module component (TIGR02574 family)